MSKTTLILACFLAVSLSISANSFGDQPQLAATNELPAALKALDLTESQIVTSDEAQKVRGQWTLNFNLPLVATAIQGKGPLDLRIITLSNGVAPGTPVLIWLELGR